MFAIARLNTFDEQRLASGRADLAEFDRLHASQPGYAGSLTIELDDSRRLTVNLWEREQDAEAALQLLGPEVRRVLAPLTTAPASLLGAGLVATDLTLANHAARQRGTTTADRQPVAAADRQPAAGVDRRSETPPSGTSLDGVWELDPQRSSVEFRAKNFWGLQTVRGRFDRYDGRLDLSAAPAIELTIEAASLQTGNARRDAHLRSGDFFDTENHPRVQFVSDTVAVQGDRLDVRGRLSARGRSLPIEVSAQIRLFDGQLEIEAATTVPHRELGMTWSPIGMLRPRSRLFVKARLSVRRSPRGVERRLS